MANQGAKKRRDENKHHMSNLLRLIVASNVIYVLVRLIIFHSTITWKHWVGLAITSSCYAIPYQQLAKMAKPTYSDNGELIDGGFDMSTGGICGYLHDIIYITAFVQLSSIINGKFWYTYLVIPMFAAYKAFDLLKGTLSGSQEPEEDAKTRKKREKMERKASRPKFSKVRNR